MLDNVRRARGEGDLADHSDSREGDSAPDDVSPSRSFPAARQEVTAAVARSEPVRIVTAGTTAGVVFLSVLVVAVLLFLIFAQYGRKETVLGVVLPTNGAVMLVAPRIGVVERLMVEEGESVSRGQPLVALRANAANASGENLSTLFDDALSAEALALEQRETAERRHFEALQVSLNEQLKRLESDDAIIAETERYYDERLSLAEADVAAFRRLVEQEAETPMRLRSAESKVLELQISGQQLQLRRVEAEKERQRVIAQKEAMKSEQQQVASELAKAAAAFSEKRATATGNATVVLTAEADGKLTALNVRAGGSVVPGQTIATILPAGVDLEGRVWLPSRAIGFVQPADQIRIMYDAFPFQHFGLADGKVARISASPNEMEDLPAFLNASEPHYAATVILQTQTMERNGVEWPLRSGMRFRADIVLERRSMLGWLLSPFQNTFGRQLEFGNAVRVSAPKK